MRHALTKFVWDPPPRILTVTGTKNLIGAADPKWGLVHQKMLFWSYIEHYFRSYCSTVLLQCMADPAVHVYDMTSRTLKRANGLRIVGFTSKPFFMSYEYKWGTVGQYSGITRRGA